MNRTDGIKKLMGYVEEMQKEGINVCWPQFQQYDLLEMCLISKHYGLIKWLVEKNKIDFDKVYEKEKAEKTDICIYGRNGTEEKTYWLLMILSIQDNPIDFLVSILK